MATELAVGEGSTMRKCGGVIDAAKETLVLALEFVDKTLLNSPELVVKVLTNPKVKKAIEDTLLAEAKRLTNQQQRDQTIHSEDGIKVLTAVGNSAFTASKVIAIKEITSSAQYRAVKEGLKELECAYRSSPVGVFVDKNKGWLIVVATGLALGGATAMYVSKSGDWPAGQMAKLADKLVRFKVLGNVEVGLKDVEFKPSTRLVKATTFASANWKAISTTVSFQVGFKDDKFASTNAKGEIVVQAGKRVTLTGKGSIGYNFSPDVEPGSQSLTYDLSLGVAYGANIGDSSLNLRLLGYATQESLQRKQGGSFSASYEFIHSKSTSISADLDAKLSRTQKFLPSGPVAARVEGEVILGLTVKFP